MTKTNHRYTETNEGPINHLRVCGEFGVIHAPVCVTVPDHSMRGLSEPQRLPKPIRDAGKLLFALPGGGRMQA